MIRPDPPVDLGRMPYTFAIVGVQKSGTTSLAGTINRHPLVARPPSKERHYFDDESVDWSAPDYERDYTAPRRAPIHERVGDSSPTYLFWPRAMERMHAFNPDMPLISIFRDPLERLVSHWVMLRWRNPRWPDWPQFITDLRPTSLPLELPTDMRPTRYKHLSGIARGYYGEALERALAIFPREQWLLLEFRQMLADFAHTVDRATDHIGLPRFGAVPPLENWYAGADLVAGTAPTAADVQGLADLYAKDLALFERLSGIDTSAWPTRKVLDKTMDPEELANKFAAKLAPPGVTPEGRQR